MQTEATRNVAMPFRAPLHLTVVAELVYSYEYNDAFSQTLPATTMPASRLALHGMVRCKRGINELPPVSLLKPAQSN